MLNPAVCGIAAAFRLPSLPYRKTGQLDCRPLDSKYLSIGSSRTMRKTDLTSMNFDELWKIHEQLTEILSERIIAEKRELEKRLALLNRVEERPFALAKRPPENRAPRRTYPKVLPKYSNPLSPSETWSGRGKQPRWVVAALKTGHRLDEFRIRNEEKKDGKKEVGRG
jgi:DNA-binding protein H-NS